MPEPRLFAVAGRPVLHSLSPLLFRAGFAAAALADRYTRLAAGGASEVLAAAVILDLAGLNVTAPFKSSIVPHLDDLDDTARRLEAVNTVVRRDGRWIGSNTDPSGVLGALASAGFGPRSKRALVVGAGGAGRAAADALTRAGGQVIIVNRTGDKAALAAAALGCRSAAWEDRIRETEAADLVVSCIPAGARAVDARFPLPGQVMLEAPYPRRAVPARDGPPSGGLVIPGEAWLLHQALASFEEFTGMKAPRAAMERALGEGRSPGLKLGLALVGFMGAGKSAIGRLVAEKTRASFADTDALIEAKTGLAVPDLFALFGEEGFRALESRVLASLPSEAGSVWALGGGLVLDPKNRGLIRQKAVTFWILADPARSAGRLAPGTRPLLAGANPAGRAETLFRARIAAYADAADAVVLNADGAGNAEAAAERIIDEIRRLR